MSRPKGSKNKSKESDLDITLGANPVTRGSYPTTARIPTYQEVVSPGTFEKLKPSIHYDAIFGIRFLRKDSLFPGLWELVKLDDKMNRVKVITDANARGQVQILLMREVKRIVAVA